MLQKFLQNHVLANVAFVVVLLVGILVYLNMPRAQDPDVNFNWISIVTVLPGASTEDVEKLVTDPLEDAIQQVQDIKFVSSTSRESISDILVRFEDIDERTFDKRLNDLRREIQSEANAELPEEAEDPVVLEITTSNSFPTATLVVTGPARDELLRKTALNVRKDLQRLAGVDDVNEAGLVDPELNLSFDPQALRVRGISPMQLVETVRSHFRDTVAGDMQLGEQEWLVRVAGAFADPEYLARLPVSGTGGEVLIGHVAAPRFGHDEFTELATYQGKPAIQLAVTKQATANVLDLVERINAYLEAKNPVLEPFGMRVVLLDDQTETTRNAIEVMQNNAILGLFLVMFVTWLFLGSKISFFIGIGIPFVLAGTFWMVDISGQTLNQNVLLGVVIVLGMLVDDAVVVVEAIYYRIQRGAEAMRASIDSLYEVFAPVTSSIATTLAAFLPLMLLPGIVGKFMFVVPFVVSVALVISLLEAYWMLPVHVSMVGLNLQKPGRVQRWRMAFTHWLRLRYSKVLIKSMRRPLVSLAVALLLFVIAVGAVVVGKVRLEFFAFDPMRLFYVNVEMPPGTPLEHTLSTVEAVEAQARNHLAPGDLRSISSVAGQMFTETAPFFGDQYGQVMISLNPRRDESMRGVSEIIEAMRAAVTGVAGARSITLLKLSQGPPVTKPISIKVRGDSFTELRKAADALRGMLGEIPAVTDITDNDSPGKHELKLEIDTDAVRRAGLDAAAVAGTVRLLFEGDVVAYMQYEGERLEVRVQARQQELDGIDELLQLPLALPTGGSIPLGQLVRYDTGFSRSNIRHYDFRRAITVEADLNKQEMDTLEANRIVMEKWNAVRLDYPQVDLDFSGELDDIQESLDSMLILFLFGVGLIYLILGTQFRSYWQPFMILATLPLAFTGVTFGLIVTGNPLSLFTLYGVVALAGITVNAAIVMIDAANRRLEEGMSITHATVYAARRRVIPVVITSATTIAGLFSLATGLGGESLIWGPVASAIVWGLGFSTVLTLFLIPVLFRLFMRPSYRHPPAT